MKTEERNRCTTCRKDRATERCPGCSGDFCPDHMIVHREMLNTHLNHIEAACNRCRQCINDQKSEPPQHPLLQQINQWEQDAIDKIQKTAEEARQALLQHTADHIRLLEADLSKLTNQVRRGRTSVFPETNLQEWDEQLRRLSEKIEKPANIYLRGDWQSGFINKIHVGVTSLLRCAKEISSNARWMQNGITVAGDQSSGPGRQQLHSPDGLYVDDDLSVYVADYTNHRIVKWTKDAEKGEIIVGGDRVRRRNDCLLSPSDVVIDKTTDSLIISEHNNRRVIRWSRQNAATVETLISGVSSWGLCMDNDGYLYVSDYQNNEVKRWKIGDAGGVVVAGGNGEGQKFEQLNGPTHIFVDNDRSVYVSDMKNHRVMKWLRDAEQGIVVAGGHNQGYSLGQLSSPFGVAVDRSGNVYVVDRGNHRVVRWLKGASEGTIVVGGRGQGNQQNQLSSPTGLAFDRYGHIYVADDENHRVQKFVIDYN